VFPHLGSTDISFSSYPLKAKYVGLMGKDKGYNSSHAYCQVKEWSKKSCKIFSNDFWKGFWNGMMEGKKMGSNKKGFDVAMFFSSQSIDFPFLFEETLGAFLFLSFPFSSFFSLSFFNTFSLLFFYAPSLWGLRDFDDIWGQKQPSKILFKWHGMIWLIHDYEDGGVVDISVVDAYSRVELCMPIFLGEASK
jgi:hypothetical protein